jgi:hypothetical protein
MNGPLTTLETELTMRRSDFAFLHAAFQHAGWEITEDIEGVTTDDGYDHELRARVRIRVPLETIAAAPDQRDVVGDTADDILRGLRVVA